jgi:hypothetical protein
VQWVTRARPKVDRIACPWLIKRFVDVETEFLFVPAEEVLTVAEQTGAIPCDAPGVELGHHGAECSFDAIIKKYDLSDPALLRLARIVRGAGTPDKDLTPESRGLEAVADGFRQIYPDDHEQLSAESIVYDALYEYCQHQVSKAR